LHVAECVSAATRSGVLISWLIRQFVEHCGCVGELQLLKLLDMGHRGWKCLLLLVHEVVVGNPPPRAVATTVMRSLDVASYTMVRL
jgi:hypothetical protein